MIFIEKKITKKEQLVRLSSFGNRSIDRSIDYVNYPAFLVCHSHTIMDDESIMININ